MSMHNNMNHEPFMHGRHATYNIQHNIQHANMINIQGRQAQA